MKKLRSVKKNVYVFNCLFYYMYQFVGTCETYILKFKKKNLIKDTLWPFLQTIVDGNNSFLEDRHKNRGERKNARK